MKSIKEQVEAIVQYFKPSKLPDNFETQSRTEGFIRLMLFTSSTLVPITLLNFLVVNVTNEPLILFVSFIAPISILFLLKFTNHLASIVNVFLVIICGIIVYESLNSGGGIYSRNLLLLFLVPTFAFLFANRISGLCWTVICSLSTIAIYAYSMNPIADEAMEQMAMADAFNKHSSLADVLFGIVFGAVLIYYSTRRTNKLVRNLEKNRIDIKKNNQELEQFAYATSHDLKQPILTVSNFVGLLEGKLEGEEKLNEESKTFFSYINRATDNMQQLIKDLLTYATSSGEDEIEFTTTKLNDILSKVQLNLEHQINEIEGIQIVVNPLPTIVANSSKLQQLFQNLLSNALKFRHEVRTLKIIVSCMEEKEYYKFSISDNGQGIPREQLNKIFLPFKKAHSSSTIQGSGIGLATANRIVELHQGKIWAESEFGQGATIFFTISNKIKQR